MNSNNQKGFIGTILFHGLLFLCVFLMSFAGAGGGGGDNGTGEALGGIEVSLGEPDLGGPDSEAGYAPQQDEASATEKPVDEQTLTEDDVDAPILPSKEVEKKPVVTEPKITTPVFKPTKPNPVPEKRPDSKGLFTKKGGNKGDGTKPGNEGRPDGTVFGDNGKGDGNGDGDGKPGNGNGDGEGDGDGPGKGPGTGDGPGGPGKDGPVNFDLSGFKKNREFNIETSKPGTGSVKIKLCVNKDGSIKSVNHVLGGTMTDKYFIDLALKAVRENTYSPTRGSTAETTCGFVTFNFKAR